MYSDTSLMWRHSREKKVASLARCPGLGFVMLNMHEGEIFFEVCDFRGPEWRCSNAVESESETHLLKVSSSYVIVCQ